MRHPKVESRWVLRDPSAREHLIPRLPQVVAEVLSARGIRDRPAADAFYKPLLAPDHDPLELPDMPKALQRVSEALANHELVALYGDFDADGVTSLAVLSIALEGVGAQIMRYIPERFSEGYGLNIPAVEHLAAAGATLLITADCGISSVDEVARANELGVDVIILDHHTVPPVMPAALACVNPKRPDSVYPFSEMAAVGVSFRFAQALYDHLGRTLNDDDLIDLVALGTVADVAPLEDENRRMVVAGLRAMRTVPRPGIQALLTAANVRPDKVSAESFGFALGPRINAAGRLAHANKALDLLLAPDLHTAFPLAEELDRLNSERQKKTKTAMEEVSALVGDPVPPLIMVGSPTLDAGIVGLVAARLAEHYHRPAIAFQQFEHESRASARSIPEFDIVAAIRKESNLLNRHGGHRAAAGFSVPNENVDELRGRLENTAAELLDGLDLRPSITIDAEAPLEDLTEYDIRGLMQFEPCGYGNERPVLLSRRVRVVGSRTVGVDQTHRKLELRVDGVRWEAIAFGQAHKPLADFIDVVYSLQHGWKGDTVELNVKDFAPSADMHPLEGAA